MMSVLHAIIVANVILIVFNLIGMTVAPGKGPPPIWCYILPWVGIVVTLSN